MKLGEKLSLMIKQKGMNVNQVAVDANVPPSSIYSIIQRNSTKVEIDSFIRICNVLGCKPEDFSDEILAASNKLQKISTLSEDEQTVISAMRSLNYDGIVEMINYSHYLTTQARFLKEYNKDASEA